MQRARSTVTNRHDCATQLRFRVRSRVEVGGDRPSTPLKASTTSLEIGRRFARPLRRPLRAQNGRRKRRDGGRDTGHGDEGHLGQGPRALAGGQPPLGVQRLIRHPQELLGFTHDVELPLAARPRPLQLRPRQAGLPTRLAVQLRQRLVGTPSTTPSSPGDHPPADLVADRSRGSPSRWRLPRHLPPCAHRLPRVGAFPKRFPSQIVTLADSPPLSLNQTVTELCGVTALSFPACRDR
jgi:hypothetical protein